MRNILITSAMLIFLLNQAFGQTEKGIQLATYDIFEEFSPLLKTEGDSTYVINFWATWCKPCVKELPYFESLNEQLEGQKVKVILVSLDFKRQIDKKLIPFIVENNIQSEVMVLTDTKTQQWIDLVDESWSGAIPATLVFNKDKRLFVEEEFASYEELEELIKPFLN